MPGVTFFCVFVRPETNRQGVVTTPLVGRGLKAIRAEFSSKICLCKEILNLSSNFLIRLQCSSAPFAVMQWLQVQLFSTAKNVDCLQHNSPKRPYTVQLRL